MLGDASWVHEAPHALPLSPPFTGNSGGPAFADMEVGCVAGVAFSKNVGTGTDNIGYIIPWAVVDHFLSEYTSHGTHRGLVSPGFYTQPMENPAQQRYLQVGGGVGGVCLGGRRPVADGGLVCGTPLHHQLQAGGAVPQGVVMCVFVGVSAFCPRLIPLLFQRCPSQHTTPLPDTNPPPPTTWPSSLRHQPLSAP